MGAAGCSWRIKVDAAHSHRPHPSADPNRDDVAVGSLRTADQRAQADVASLLYRIRGCRYRASFKRQLVAFQTLSRKEIMSRPHRDALGLNAMRDGLHRKPLTFGGEKCGSWPSRRWRGFAGSDLRLVRLRLIADTPHHGYERIHEIEARTGSTAMRRARHRLSSPSPWPRRWTSSPSEAPQARGRFFPLPRQTRTT